MRPARSRGAVTALVAILTGCAAPAVTTSPARGTASGPARAGGSSAATPTPHVAATLAACPAPVSFSSLAYIPVTGADDVAVAPDGSLWVSDPGGGRLIHVTTDGSVASTLSDPRTPEGIVVLGADSLALAEQGPDRVVLLQPSTMHETTLLQLNLPSGAMGLDGIAAGVAGDTLLVPDSPNGRLLSLSLDGASQTLASGLGRPVAAAVAGGIVVAAENSTGLYLVPSGGGAGRPLGGVTDADDVVAAGSLVYVTSLATHQLLAVDPVTGESHVMVTGVDMPQGVALLPDGRVALADSTSGRVAVTSGC